MYYRISEYSQLSHIYTIGDQASGIHSILKFDWWTGFLSTTRGKSCRRDDSAVVVLHPNGLPISISSHNDDRHDIAISISFD